MTGMHKVQSARGAGRTDPPGLVPVLYYEHLLGELPRDVLSSALRAALDCHRPERHAVAGGDDYHLCSCRDKGGQRYRWPCPEVRAVIAALGLEELHEEAS